MLLPKPQRCSEIVSITARGSTRSTSCMNVPSSSRNGPNSTAFSQPMTSVKNASASATSGTVMPIWSTPRMPGMGSASAGMAAQAAASASDATMASNVLMLPTIPQASRRDPFICMER